MKISATRIHLVAVALGVAGLLLLSGRPITADDQKPDEKKKDNKKTEKKLTEKDLEGVWSGARFDSGDGENPEKGVKLQLTIKENRVVGKRLPEGDIGEGTIKLSKDGKEIDATGDTGGYREKKYQGIIKIKDDTLYWCVATEQSKNQKRPTEFVASPTDRTYLIVVKREKP